MLSAAVLITRRNTPACSMSRKLHDSSSRRSWNGAFVVISSAQVVSAKIAEGGDNVRLWYVFEINPFSLDRSKQVTSFVTRENGSWTVYGR